MLSYEWLEKKLRWLKRPLTYFGWSLIEKKSTVTLKVAFWSKRRSLARIRMTHLGKILIKDNEVKAAANDQEEKQQQGFEEKEGFWMIENNGTKKFQVDN